MLISNFFIITNLTHKFLVHSHKLYKIKFLYMFRAQSAHHQEVDVNCIYAASRCWSLCVIMWWPPPVFRWSIRKRFSPYIWVNIEVSRIGHVFILLLALRCSSLQHSFSRKPFLSVLITGVNWNAVFKVTWTSAESIRWHLSAGPSSAEIGWSHILQAWENVVVGQAIQCNAWWAATAQAVTEMSQDSQAPTLQDASGKLLPS